MIRDRERELDDWQEPALFEVECPRCQDTFVTDEPACPVCGEDAEILE